MTSNFNERKKLQPTYRSNEEVDLLASADEAVAGVISVQHHKAGCSDWICNPMIMIMV